MSIHTAQRGMFAMLNDRGVRGAQIEYRAYRVGRESKGWYINGKYAGEHARAAKTAIRVNPDRFKVQP